MPLDHSCTTLHRRGAQSNPKSRMMVFVGICQNTSSENEFRDDAKVGAQEIGDQAEAAHFTP